MSILAVIFGILSGCFLAVLVGIIGSHRRIGFGWAFLISLIFTPLVGLIVALLTDPLPGGGQRWGCVGTVVAILGLLFFAAFLLLALTIFWCVSKEEGYYLLFVGFFGTVLNQFLKRRFDSGIFLKEGSSTEVEEPVGYAHRDDYGD